MARTTAAQFARQLRRLGATVTIRDGRDSSDVVASYRGVEVTARFGSDVDAFDVARRTDTAPDTAPDTAADIGAADTGAGDAASDDADLIRSMAGVRRMLNLPKHPVVTLGTTGRRNSRIHILRPGWFSSAECGVSIPREHREGTPREATCRRCRSLWRQR